MSGAAAVMHMLLHGFELLFLLVVEDGFDFALGLLAERLHFCAAILLRGRLILEDGFHFLLPFEEQGLDLGLLIGAESEFAGHVFELPVGIHPARTTAGLALFLGGGGVVLGRGSAAHTECEDAAEGEGKEFGPHGLIFLRFCLRNRPENAGQGLGSSIAPAGIWKAGEPVMEVDGERQEEMRGVENLGRKNWPRK